MTKVTLVWFSGLIATFTVQECQPIYGNCQFETTDNEANFIVNGGLRNVTGRAESLGPSYLIGTRGTREVDLGVRIPMIHYMKVEIMLFYAE